MIRIALLLKFLTGWNTGLVCRSEGVRELQARGARLLLQVAAEMYSQKRGWAPVVLRIAGWRSYLGAFDYSAGLCVWFCFWLLLRNPAMQRLEPRRSERWCAVCSTGAFDSAGIVVFRLGFIVLSICYFVRWCCYVWSNLIVGRSKLPCRIIIAASLPRVPWSICTRTLPSLIRN